MFGKSQPYIRGILFKGCYKTPVNFILVSYKHLYIFYTSKVIPNEHYW
jgi:hypothetical protein